VSEILTPLRLVDLAIVWILIEGILLSVRYRARGQPAAALWSFANSVSGLMLLLAARAALAGAGAIWLALSLAGALLAHLGELAARRGVLAGHGSDST
jgi:hypothetical protein